MHIDKTYTNQNRSYKQSKVNKNIKRFIGFAIAFWALTELLYKNKLIDTNDYKLQKQPQTILLASTILSLIFILQNNIHTTPKVN